LRTQLQHGFAVSFLQLLELALVLLAHVLRLGAQRVLHPALVVLDPALDLRRWQIELPACPDTLVLPWMTSSTSADFRRTV